MEEITGKISGVIFSNKGAGFYIFRVQHSGKHITVKGTFPGQELDPGLTVKIRGNWINHQTYGKQFQANTCEIIPEKNRNGIITYLVNHVKSVGIITAGRLYQHFGDDLLDILDNDPERIIECEFLRREQIDSIISEWKEAKASRSVSIFLTDLGLTANQIKSVYSHFGVSTFEVIKDNPYKIMECPAVGFPTADQLARHMGIGVDDKRRVDAFIIHVISDLSSSEGHIFVTSDQISGHASKSFKRSGITPFSHGDYLSDSHLFTSLGRLIKSESVVSENDKIYLTRNYKNEYESSKSISEMISQSPINLGDLSEELEEFENEKNITLSKEQREAFLLLEKSRVAVISGYPGTGKTLLISCFVELFERKNLHYVLMSPTGIAAKRLSQVTGKSALTIHRALGYNGSEWAFNSDNKFDADAVIVDEMSMVDSSVFYRLVTALKPTTMLILVGDSAQLPSVGAGYVLNSLINNKNVPHITLSRIYRQKKNSDIVTVAHQILRGESVDTSFNKDSQFVFFSFPENRVVNEICEVASLMKDKKSNFQVIAPKYEGALGVNSLNRSMREVLNSDFKTGKAAKIKHGSTDLYEGDRIMVIRNDYQRMVFNGDTGKVTRIDIKKDEVEVKIFDWFDHESTVPRYIDKIFTFKLEEARSQLRVAYACTAHKVQGQEFDYVLLPMDMQYGIMLYRNLIYTAITRAKKKVFLFGDPGAFSYSISNIRETSRNSSLSEMIDENMLLLSKTQSFS